ncbi:hypothetical protein IDSA_10385 [Pseudidiomarina salinarum]|uniref:Serine/threonine protein kinase n=1 Tax=Pseudidiomarina salinarum TaxID=435908 RepID=A0A094IRZ6_9GAMM|nr:hypothetical protein [Pseudidiomarina salinarum]KFZ30460.1 hypothetical protein IDSA_10385 [Pseudidiomarina salinarum]RUO68607.1 hypothetical protein CWI79_11085 [Pseudidiomarina salinarum]
MKANNFLALSAITASLLLAGCGGDINLTPTSIDNSTDNSVTNPGGGSTENNCASYVDDGVTVRGQVDGDNCVYPPNFSTPNNPIMTNLRIVDLANDGAHIFPNGLYIGNGLENNAANIPSSGPVLTIDAGATLAFQDADGFVQIARGSRIIAEGTATAPITFTSDEDLTGNVDKDTDRGLWGGVILLGRGISNKCDQNDLANCNLEAEGGAGLYGGADNSDNSGVLSHVVVKYAGFEVAVGNELNGITFYTIGDATQVDNIQVHNNVDDGVEFFGGAVNAKYVVLTGNGDDSLDWADGWSGAIQYIYVRHNESLANRGIEGDNNSGNFTAEPFTSPQIANMTIVGSNFSTTDRDSEGVLLRRGTQAELYNFVVTGPELMGECLELDDQATVDHIATDNLVIESSVIACAENFADQTTEDWFTAGTNNLALTDTATVLDGGLYTASPMLDASGAQVSPTAKADLSTVNPFFDDVDFVGAVSADDDWTQGWAFDLNNNQ